MGQHKNDLVQTTLRVQRVVLKDFKRRALEKNITLKTWILQAIAQQIMQEDGCK